MLSGPDGSPRSNDPAIRSVGRTILPQRDLALLAENVFLRQQNAAQNERIEGLENRLKQYENAHTLSSKQGGAGQQPQNEESEQDEENKLLLC
ncbi:ISH10-type transposase ISHwa11 [Halococcus thailandensis JCM 13552]|uniref:ISH10-type transposase ISHwa11 n=1 Tax=Halococcus thailandensis JCM 13552 TaxID=1227457 RepID=M0NHT8_9EURY|nr:ISH10-type transposase ISHwa11 [Halococcus thailandensis JCM 13552]